MSEEMTEAQQELAATNAEIRELKELMDGLEERARDADEKVTAEELGEKWGLLRLAELRQQRAEEKRQRGEAKELARRQGEAAAAAEAELSQLGLAQMAPHYKQAVESLLRLRELCALRQAAIGRHIKALRAVGATDPAAGIWVEQVGEGYGSWRALHLHGVRYDYQDVLRPDLIAGHAVVEGSRPRGSRPPDTPVRRYLDLQVGQGGEASGMAGD